MEPNNLQQQPMGADQEIDLIELAQKLWQGRRMIVKWCLAGALAGLVIGFSIPKEYTVTVKLAPEIQGGKTSLGGLSSLASMAGINVGSMNSADAMSPELYPDIVQSVPFMTELFDVEVADQKGLTAMPLRAYVSEELRSPWWSAVVAAPFKALEWFMGLFRAEEPANEGPVDPFRLTKEDSEVVKSLQERIAASVDKKTMVVSLSVTMQDPLIAATLTDTVMQNLQNHITQYRTENVVGLQPLQPDGSAVAAGQGEGPGIDPGLRRGTACDGAVETLETLNDVAFGNLCILDRYRCFGVDTFWMGVHRCVPEKGG